MKKSLVILLLFLSQVIFAQVDFTATASRTTIGLNENVRVDFKMNSDGDNFSPPSLDGFKVVGGPSQQVSYSNINGKSSYSKSYVLILQPTRKGKLTIGPASIEIENKIYKTSPIEITVTNPVETAKNNPNNSAINIDEHLYLVAEVSNTNPYLNQPITVQYKLYFKDLGLRNFNVLATPKYNDFWSHNIEVEDFRPEMANYKGSTFNSIVVKKVVLYPQKSGKLSIEPLNIDLSLEVPTNRRDMFGRSIYGAANKTLSTGTQVINVKDLPQNNNQESFTGAVGEFSFDVIPSKTQLRHGESLELKVKVAGSGNLKLFSLPEPILPNALESYDPIYSEKVSTTLAGSRGEVSNKYTIIPQYQGKYIIKPISFTYFDLKSKSYKTFNSQEITIEVLDGPLPGTDAEVATNTGISKQKVQAKEQFKFINLKTSLVDIKKKDFLFSPLFFVLWLLPFVLIPIIVLAKKKKQAIDSDVVGNKVKQSNKLAKKYLSEAKANKNNKELFYVSLEKSMHNFLKAKLHIETSEMSKDRIKEVLSEKNVDQVTIQEFIDLIQSCEFARYAPSTQASIEDDYLKADQLISKLNKSI